MQPGQIHNTSRYSTAVVRCLVAFASESMDPGDMVVKVVDHARSGSGRSALQTVHPGRPDAERRVMIRLGAADRFPCTTRDLWDWNHERIEVRDWQEGLVWLTARKFAQVAQGMENADEDQHRTTDAAHRTLERFRAMRDAMDLDGLAKRERVAERREAARLVKPTRSELLAEIVRWHKKKVHAEVALKELLRRLRQHDRRAALRDRDR